jgi:hypothetical protein
MTRLLEQAVEAVSALHEEAQDDLARILLQLAGVDRPPCELTPEEAADLDASLAEAARGEFATDEEVCAVWARHGLRRPAARPLVPSYLRPERIAVPEPAPYPHR